jgi:hypothetical protein
MHHGETVLIYGVVHPTIETNYIKSPEKDVHTEEIYRYEHQNYICQWGNYIENIQLE